MKRFLAIAFILIGFPIVILGALCCAVRVWFTFGWLALAETEAFK